MWWMSKQGTMVQTAYCLHRPPYPRSQSPYRKWSWLCYHNARSWEFIFKSATHKSLSLTLTLSTSDRGVGETKEQRFSDVPFLCCKASLSFLGKCRLVERTSSKRRHSQIWFHVPDLVTCRMLPSLAFSTAQEVPVACMFSGTLPSTKSGAQRGSSIWIFLACTAGWGSSAPQFGCHGFLPCSCDRHHLFASLNPTPTVTSISWYPKVTFVYPGTTAVGYIYGQSYDQWNIHK